MSNYITALNTQLMKALADVTELRTLELDDMGMWDMITAMKDALILAGDVGGVPVGPLLRYIEGVTDLSTGRSQNYWSLAGWSDHALGLAHQKSAEMGLVKRNINKGGGKWYNLKKEAKEVFGDDYKSKETALKRLHGIYTKFGLDNPDVNFLMQRGSTNKEKAKYLRRLKEDMGNAQFTMYYGKLKRAGVVSTQLDKAYKELD
jgi:hypothetical protein